MNDTLGSILLVEDEPQSRLFLEQVLTRKGYRVECFANAEDALERMDRGNSISLVIIDVQLPGMDGVALAAEVARLHPGVPVLFVTGDPSRVTKPGYIVLGKPVNNQELLDHVWQHVKIGQMMLNFREVKKDTTTCLTMMGEVKEAVKKLGARQDETLVILNSRIEATARVAETASNKADTATTAANNATLAANSITPATAVKNWKEKLDPFSMSLMTVLAGVILWFVTSYKEDLVEKATGVDAKIDKKLAVVQAEVKKTAEKLDGVDRGQIVMNAKITELDRGQSNIDRKMDRVLWRLSVPNAPNVPAIPPMPAGTPPR